MAEPTMRDLERMILKGNRTNVETLLEVKAEVAKLAAEQSGNKLLIASVDELTARVDHLTDRAVAAEQILTGMRSQGDSSFDIAVALSRRFRKLIQRLTEKGLIAIEALREDELETAEEHAGNKLRSASTRPAQ